MNFRILSSEEAYSYYKSLYSKEKKSYSSFNGMDFFNLKLFKGDFLLLRNRFDLKVFVLLEKDKARIICTHYQAKSPDSGIAHSLGCFLVANDINSDEISFFTKQVAELLRGLKVLYPLNGHFNLGVSAPSADHDPKKITFLTSAGNVNVRKVLNSFQNHKLERTFHSMLYQVENHYSEKIGIVVGCMILVCFSF